MVFPIGTEEKVDSQCPDNIAVTSFGVVVSKEVGQVFETGQR
jgi:hypothetical protein